MPLSRFKSMYKTIIFDWDGTLHNTKKLYGKAFRVAYDYLVKEGYAPEKYYSDEETSVYLGMTPPDMWQAFMPDLPEDVKKTAAAMIGQNMDKIVADGGAILFPGAIETLEYLKDKDYTLIILSNCRNAYMDNHRAYFKLDRFFSDYYTAEAYNYIPKEEIVVSIMNKYSGEYMIVGDRSKDINAGLAHNIYTVACDFGFGSQEELSGASTHIKELLELKNIL